MARWVVSRARLQVGYLLHSQADSISLRAMFPQQQTGVSDCGLFAIATATALCFGIPPSTTLWGQPAMRGQLLRCLEGAKMAPFPAWDIPKPSIKTIADEPAVSTTKVRIYCSCRLPSDRRQKMASCSSCGMWFHKTCENISDSVFSRKSTFTCQSCL